MEVIDNEGPEESMEASANGMKAYMVDAMADLAMEIKDIKVSCE